VNTLYQGIDTGNYLIATLNFNYRAIVANTDLDRAVGIPTEVFIDNGELVHRTMCI
jgi:hypothetical protein